MQTMKNKKLNRKLQEMMYKTITMDKLHRGHTHITGQSAYECEDLLFYLTLNIFMLLLLLIQLCGCL